MRVIGALLLAAAGLQPPAQETDEAAGKWIDQLRADSLEKREEASLHLENMGPRARGDLEKAAGSFGLRRRYPRVSPAPSPASPRDSPTTNGPRC
jgi:hypothetical protein